MIIWNDVDALSKSETNRADIFQLFSAQKSQLDRKKEKERILYSLFEKFFFPPCLLKREKFVISRCIVNLSFFRETKKKNNRMPWKIARPFFLGSPARQWVIAFTCWISKNFFNNFFLHCLASNCLCYSLIFHFFIFHLSTYVAYKNIFWLFFWLNYAIIKSVNSSSWYLMTSI